MVVRVGIFFGGVRWADFDGDGKSDYLTIADSGAANVT